MFELREKELLSLGYKYICGVDEVGRGAWAGPIVAAAVIMKPCFFDMSLEDLKNSKKLSKKKRLEWFPVICSNAVDISISVLSAKIIDSEGLQSANKNVVYSAVSRLHICTYVLSDYIAGISFPCDFDVLKKGDERVVSIACASIIAKVYRDWLLDRYGLLYPGYGFEKHAGYGTQAHVMSIQKYGILPIHRLSYAIFNKLANLKKI
jgi:ribonuclease HII